MRLVAERGPDAFTLREVARQAEVSHAAPYHHFADKAALIDALIELCFARFERALRDGVEGAEGDPSDRLVAMGVAYVLFAWEHQSEFQLLNRCKTDPAGDGAMYGSPIPSERDSAPQDSPAYGAFQVLLDGLAACQAAGLVRPGDLMPLALSAWSVVHGLATLLIEGPLRRDAVSRPAVEAMARTVTQTLWRGLLVR